ncbi:MAG: acyl-CoA thioesterase [Burkholderiales bacterium]|nr:acyl-CoA thioesterase [Burkholderiales bacterium]
MAACRHHISHFTVEFGDCDPAQIVFYPNYFRWMDAASLRYFRAAGLPSWRELEARFGIIGTPLVDASARFLRPATYGDAIDVRTAIDEWRGRSFVMSHLIRRGDDVLVEGREIRVFARRRVDDPSRIQAVVPPDIVRQWCA